MVSFTCSVCQDVVKKPKVIGHAGMCRGAHFTCVDCMHVFTVETVKAHTSCVTEVEKYQGRWLQKCSSNGNPKRITNDSDDDDNNGDGTGAKKANGGGLQRPPRPKMDDLSDSDSDDDDWVSSRKSKPTAAAKAKPTSAPRGPAPSALKRLRGSDSDSDSEEEERQKGKSPHGHHAAPAKGKVATPGKSPKLTATPITKPKHASKEEPKEEESEAPAVKRRKTATPSSTPKVSSHYAAAPSAGDRSTAMVPKRDSPLLLPRSKTSTECMVPSFVLGTSEEVADIVSDIFAEAGVTAMREKDVSKELVQRYAARIAKSVRHAVAAAVELGSLKQDEKGNIRVA